MSDIAERVKKIVVEHLGVEAEKVADNASFIDDLGADSLDTVELVMALEEEFECEIPDEDAEKITTVQQAIDYVNAHGTSTTVNDKVETLAIRQVFGEYADKIPVSSTKSMLGHATTACGGIELAVCLLAMQSGIVPPTINLDNPSEECDLDYVPNQARQQQVDTILSNSFGMGGQNSCLVIGRYNNSNHK